MKATTALIRLAEAQGWTVHHARGGHLKWRSPAGALVVSPSTPSEHRSLANTRAQLKRAGLVTPRKDGRTA